jgi:putative superfamily III holin-X
MSKLEIPEVVGPQRERVTRLSTAQLIKQIVAQTSLLARKQIALAKAELKADVRTEAKVAGGLGIAAIGAIVTVTLLLVTVVLALALVLPGWAAGLIVSGFMALAVAITAGVSWNRRIRKPLRHSRHELEADVRFTKERFA